ncbi:hypothetical protein QFC22_003437 [Naganishia vaughanmartiniae]|uniref:Uncharacterized protein n=1 Tax=Naganishia vaughanmartiniae TaxID=1424756 RepID=A0ACC2X8X6_9TREE|nr:hypothetical protein QFC22_003437 [Naganishia vaughanmartiniae]
MFLISRNMCIAFWYTAALPPSDHGSHGSGTTTGNTASKIPKNPYAFILLSNRDLELGRPASDATFHDFEPIETQPYGASKADAIPPSQTPRDVSTSERVQTGGRKILSGRDSADSVGGTWLGLGVYQQPKLNSGRIGVLTNIHDDSPVPKGTKSRGALLRDWLRGLPQGEETVQPQIATRRYVDGLKDDAVQLAGFNLLLFDIVMKDVPSITLEAGGKAVDRVSALQLTNRYRPSKSAYQDESVTATIPADESTLEMGDQARILPIPPDEACSMESPLGVFQAAITELKPCALRMGGMSNSLLEEPFPKVLDGLQELEGILKEQLMGEVEWTEEQEQHLLNKLFHLMKYVSRVVEG